MITGVHHLAIVARNAQTLASYLCATAGYKPAPAAHSQSFSLLPDCSLAVEAHLLAGPNSYLEVLQLERNQPLLADKPALNQIGLRHFCAQSCDCEPLAQSVRANGGALIADPLDLGTGNQYAYTRDPEGNLMEIEGLPYASDDLPTWIGHAAIVTADLDKAIAFYCTLLGSKLRSRAMVGPGPMPDRMSGFTDARLEGAWIPAGNMLIELWQFHSPKSETRPRTPKLLDPGYSHIAFECTDIEEDAKRLIDLGASRHSYDVSNNAFVSAFFRDPEGGLIELIEPRDSEDTLAIAALVDPGVCARLDGWN